MGSDQDRWQVPTYLSGGSKGPLCRSVRDASKLQGRAAPSLSTLPPGGMLKFKLRALLVSRDGY